VLYDVSGTASEFFCYNAIGSTVALTDSTGVATSTNSYEAFGKVVASTGGSDNDRLFCTKERSAIISLDNFGHRYYDSNHAESGINSWVAVYFVGIVES